MVMQGCFGISNKCLTLEWVISKSVSAEKLVSILSVLFSGFASHEGCEQSWLWNSREFLFFFPQASLLPLHICPSLCLEPFLARSAPCFSASFTFLCITSLWSLIVCVHPPQGHVKAYMCASVSHTEAPALCFIMALSAFSTGSWIFLTDISDSLNPRLNSAST